MRTWLAVLLFAIASCTFAPSGVSQTAAAPGCGANDVKFEVSSDKSQHPFVKPEPGKALIYFLQDDTFFESRPRPTTRFGINGQWIGATQSNAYFYVSVVPGEQHLCAGWQNFVGFTSGPKMAASHFTAEAGSSYFFIVRNHWREEHGGPAGMKLEPVDSDEAQLLMSKFAFSTFRARK